MQFSTLCVAKRTRSVQNGMRRGAPHDSCDDRSHALRGNAVRDALRRQEDAERPERHTTRSAARWSGFSVVMQFATLCVARGRGAPTR
ncbi:hypothetical protein ALQ09_101916 [Pseudomonas viridiflava]|nr:hypothetical protein ALQ09_101916 [Pseudomonas viridiflava]